jgi:hypothetical protein
MVAGFLKCYLYLSFGNEISHEDCVRLKMVLTIDEVKKLLHHIFLGECSQILVGPTED